MHPSEVVLVSSIETSLLANPSIVTIIITSICFVYMYIAHWQETIRTSSDIFDTQMAATLIFLVCDLHSCFSPPPPTRSRGRSTMANVPAIPTRSARANRPNMGRPTSSKAVPTTLLLAAPGEPRLSLLHECPPHRDTPLQGITRRHLRHWLLSSTPTEQQFSQRS